MSINNALAVYVYRYVNVATPWGETDIELNSDQDVAQYRADPDAFAARHFRLTKGEYVEWIQSRGGPLCAAHTNRGELCRNSTGRSEIDPAKWRARHRHAFCLVHIQGLGYFSRRPDLREAAIDRRRQNSSNVIPIRR
jgi:hypothetical protein